MRLPGGDGRDPHGLCGWMRMGRHPNQSSFCVSRNGRLHEVIGAKMKCTRNSPNTFRAADMPQMRGHRRTNDLKFRNLNRVMLLVGIRSTLFSFVSAAS